MDEAAGASQTDGGVPLLVGGNLLVKQADRLKRYLRSKDIGEDRPGGFQ